MDLSFAIARNGMTAADIRQSVIANNLSNLTTAGFRAHLTDQANILPQSTRVSGVRENFARIGDPLQTGRATDFYIAGDGFFQVELAEGVGYTRTGSFTRDSEGNLVTESGHFLEPRITIPDDIPVNRIATTEDGVVIGITADGEQVQLGQLELARFINPAGLRSLGNNVYIETINSGPPFLGTPGEESLGSISDRQLEGSNVDPSEELPELLKNQRYQQFNLRVLETANSLIGQALDLFN